LAPELWQSISLERRKVKKTHLVALVVRQPKRLNLSWTNVSRLQLDWLLPRLPHLKDLQLSGNSWGSVSALCSCNCPLLTSIDLSWLQGFGDPALHDLVSPPVDRRPGLDDTVSRFHRLTSLCLAGTDISIESLKVLLKHCALLKVLDLSYCARITNPGIAELGGAMAPTRETLRELNLTGCNRLTGKIFASLEKFERLERVVLNGCPSVSAEACKSFVKKMEEMKKEVKILEGKCFIISRK
jgi:hypothetical protein